MAKRRKLEHSDATHGSAKQTTLSVVGFLRQCSCEYRWRGQRSRSHLWALAFDCCQDFLVSRQRLRRHVIRQCWSGHSSSRCGVHVASKRLVEIFDEADARSRNANEDVLSAGRPDAKSKERGADTPADTSVRQSRAQRTKSK